MKRPSSSQKRNSMEQKKIMERFSLPENELIQRKSENPANRNQFLNKPLVKGRDSLNMQKNQITAPFSRNSTDLRQNRNALLKDFEEFKAEYKNSGGNTRPEPLSKNFKALLKPNDLGQRPEPSSIPLLFPQNRSRRTHTDGDELAKNKDTSNRASTNVRVSSRFSSYDSLEPTSLPKVEDKGNKFLSTLKSNSHNSKSQNGLKPTQNGSQLSTIQALINNVSNSVNNLQTTPTNLSANNNGKHLTMTAPNTKLQGKPSHGHNLPPTPNAHNDMRHSASANSNSFQPHMSVSNGIANKNISLLPPRSSSFLFNGKEALYSVNTTNGLIRSYNEDRVSIVINIKKKSDWNQPRWPNCSYFSIFDGHGGSLCADFLKDNLHRFILENSNFPENPAKAIEEGCAHAEHEFCKFALKQTNIDKSGSCALIVLLIDDKVYIGNVGDCRAIVSEHGGKAFHSLTKDHKPEEPGEQERIVKNGGQVSKNNFLQTYKFLGSMLGGRLSELPYRVYPGGLSVARSFGDIMAKDVQLGGNPNVLIAKPEVSTYKIDRRTDFIFIGCLLKRRRSL